MAAADARDREAMYSEVLELCLCLFVCLAVIVAAQVLRAGSGSADLRRATDRHAMVLE